MLLPRLITHDRREEVLTAVAFISSGYRALVLWMLWNSGMDLPIAQGRSRRVQQRRVQEIGVRTHLAIKYEVILRSNSLEFACRAECHHMLCSI